ncbi:MAG TPA: ATPase, T2SS/T4P/T4SS family [Gemmataceae bacterium]|nr:ATPase, T2SS/T4P/T4SS family [Gemmataceae bacterium]
MLPTRTYPESRPEFGHLTQRLREFLQREPGVPPGSPEHIVLLGHQLLLDAVRERATDIHLQPESNGLRVRLRIDGSLHDAILLSPEQGERLIRRFKALAEIDPVPLRRPVDSRAVYELEGRTLHLRIAGAPAVCGEALAVRILDASLPQRGLADLGLSSADRDIINNWLADVSGALLVVGPTGSGKTTTLYALLEHLRLRSRNVVTLEDPVEYQIDGITQVQLDKCHGLDFAESLKMLLRLDPDYILLGEIRDAASAETAVRAAASGRVLMSTLHSRDAVGAITSLRNYGVADHEIVAALELIVAQRLVRKLCPDCRRNEAPTDAEKTWLLRLGQPPPETTWHASGCDKCQYTGYHGRIGVFEIWRLDATTDQWIRSHLDEHALRHHRWQQGMPSLLDDALDKAAQGLTTLEEVQTLGGQSRIRCSR